MPETPISSDWTILPEKKVRNKRLGRHIQRPDNFAMRTPATTVPKTVKWTRHTPAFNQGQIGSCTGNAAAGALMTEPLYVPGRALTEVDAVKFYSQATTYDPIQGSYPPQDTGSSGPAVAKAIQMDGYISSYGHATDLNTALGALALGPAIFGVTWYDTFDKPEKTGEVKFNSKSVVRGGHEIQAFAVDMEKQQVWFYNSWGPKWGGLKDGTFWMSFDTLTKQFQQYADATFFQVQPNLHPPK